jgi:hypothetical protein
LREGAGETRQERRKVESHFCDYGGVIIVCSISVARSYLGSGPAIVFELFLRSMNDKSSLQRMGTLVDGESVEGCGGGDFGRHRSRR